MLSYYIHIPDHLFLLLIDDADQPHIVAQKAVHVCMFYINCDEMQYSLILGLKYKCME